MSNPPSPVESEGTFNCVAVGKVEFVEENRSGTVLLLRLELIAALLEVEVWIALTDQKGEESTELIVLRIFVVGRSIGKHILLG